MGESLNLALALEGRAKVAPENEQLVVIAEAVANLPDPQIDANFMLALEQRLLTEGLEQATPARHLQAVPAQTEAPAPVRRAPVVQMPTRRLTVRRSVVAMAAAASLAAFPIAAAASSLPGSPFYGLKLRIERIQLALTGTPVQDAMRHMELADVRVGEAEQLTELGADPALIDLPFGLIEGHLRSAAALMFEHTTDDALMRTLSEHAAATEQRLREMRAIAGGGEAINTAIGTSILIQQQVEGLLGVGEATEAISIDTGSTFTGSTITESGMYRQPTSETMTTSDGGRERSAGSEPREEAPDATKKLSESAEGCQVPGSSDGLGDWLAPVARLTCT
jgi:hypothetical protein